MSGYAEVLKALASEAPVARDDVRRWIESGDPLTWSGVYALLDTSAARITPPLGDDERIDFERAYLVRCLEENPAPGEHLHGGYQAAWALARRLREWRRAGPRSAGKIRGVVRDLERLYRRNDPSVCNRILCGVLEHAFEDPAMRTWFTSWQRDPELRDAWRLAAEWGAEHEVEG